MVVLKERLPKVDGVLKRLIADPGEGERTVERNLTEIAREAALFYEQSFPIAASLYAEPRLKARHNAAMRELGTGPHIPIRGLDAYLRAEQTAKPGTGRRRHVRGRLPADGGLRPAGLRLRRDADR